MGTVLLVRHGQASFGADDYDVLSPAGWEQGRTLGRFLADTESPTAVRARRVATAPRDARGRAGEGAGRRRPRRVRAGTSSTTSASSPVARRASRRRSRRHRPAHLPARVREGPLPTGWPAPTAATARPTPGFVARVLRGVRRRRGRGGPGPHGRRHHLRRVRSRWWPRPWSTPPPSRDPPRLGALWARFDTVTVNAGLSRVVVGSTGARLLAFNEHSFPAGGSADLPLTSNKPAARNRGPAHKQSGLTVSGRPDMMAPVPTAVRATQEERSRAMRLRLLEATVELLVERGFAGTSTTLVSQRAGVSRGAQLHHFPTKNDLVLAAVEHLSAVRGAELARPPPRPAAREPPYRRGARDARRPLHRPGLRGRPRAVGRGAHRRGAARRGRRRWSSGSAGRPTGSPSTCSASTSPPRRPRAGAGHPRPGPRPRPGRHPHRRRRPRGADPRPLGARPRRPPEGAPHDRQARSPDGARRPRRRERRLSTPSWPASTTRLGDSRPRPRAGPSPPGRPPRVDRPGRRRSRPPTRRRLGRRRPRGDRRPDRLRRRLRPGVGRAPAEEMLEPWRTAARPARGARATPRARRCRGSAPR